MPTDRDSERVLHHRMSGLLAERGSTSNEVSPLLELPPNATSTRREAADVPMNHHRRQLPEWLMGQCSHLTVQLFPEVDG